MINGNMHLGKLCQYAKECPVYIGKVKSIETPVFIIKNVFCNRGINGWKNCHRYNLLSENKEVTETTTPYE